MTERLLSPTEMAERLACSRPMIYKLVNQGKLPPLIKLGERMSRVREADFDAAVQQLSQAKKTRCTKIDNNGRELIHSKYIKFLAYGKQGVCRNVLFPWRERHSETLGRNIPGVYV